MSSFSSFLSTSVLPFTPVSTFVHVALLRWLLPNFLSLSLTFAELVLAVLMFLLHWLSPNFLLFVSSGFTGSSKDVEGRKNEKREEETDGQDQAQQGCAEGDH